MSVKLALKREQEAIEDEDCRIESMSIADNTPIDELVMDSVDDVCLAMSNELGIDEHQNTRLKYAFHGSALPLWATSVAIRSSQRGPDNPSV